MRCALINSNTNIVDNIVIADPSWNPEIGLFLIPLVENEQCFIGQIYDQNSSPRFLGEPIPTQKIYTPYQFLNKFTFDERSAIRNIAKSDDIVADFLSLAQAANQIISDNPITISGMNYLVSINVLTEQRKTEILG